MKSIEQSKFFTDIVYTSKGLRFYDLGTDIFDIGGMFFSRGVFQEQFDIYYLQFTGEKSAFNYIVECIIKNEQGNFEKRPFEITGKFLENEYYNFEIANKKELAKASLFGLH